MTTLAVLDAYVEQLKKHDWTYDYSDDGGVWRRGQAVRERLRAGAQTSAILQTAFNAYLNYHFPGSYTGYDWGAAKLIRDAIVEGLRTDLKVAATTDLITPKETV